MSGDNKHGPTAGDKVEQALPDGVGVQVQLHHPSPDPQHEPPSPDVLPEPPPTAPEPAPPDVIDPLPPGIGDTPVREPGKPPQPVRV